MSQGWIFIQTNKFKLFSILLYESHIKTAQDTFPWLLSFVYYFSNAFYGYTKMKNKIRWINKMKLEMK